MDKIDWIILIGIVCLGAWVLGFCNGHDVAMAQNDWLSLMDKLENMAYALR